MQAAAQSNKFHKIIPAERVTAAQAEAYLKKVYALPRNAAFAPAPVSKDQTGMQHMRYRVTVNNVPVEDAVVTVHVKNGLVESVTGFAPNRDQLQSESPVLALSHEQALTKALNHINAQEYAWQNSGWEKRRQYEANDPTAT